MESHPGKLFVGGLSHQTTELNLRDHFVKFGEITECIILREKYTGAGRGFGFVSFADSSVVETILKEKHDILGKKVDVKRAELKIEKSRIHQHHNKEPSKNNFSENSVSQLPNSKIFVGGLPSTLTLKEFNNYFKKFGTITDKVMMYNKASNTPRGFGFITFDCEKAAKKALENRFHKLKNKQVEVKWAEPQVDCNKTLCTYISNDSRLGIGNLGSQGYCKPHYSVYGPCGYSNFASFYGYYWIPILPHIDSGVNSQFSFCESGDVGSSSEPAQYSSGFDTRSAIGASKDVCTRKNGTNGNDKETIENGDKNEINGKSTMKNCNMSEINCKRKMENGNVSEIKGNNVMENGNMSKINGKSMMGNDKTSEINGVGDDRSTKHEILVLIDNGVCAPTRKTFEN